MNDVLGMASHLKEERKCKVVLILNDEKLAGDAEADFRRYLEKVVDMAMLFEPSIQECVEIGVGERSPLADDIAKYMEALGISNIRVVQRVKRLVDELIPLMKDRDPRVLGEAVRTLCILGWIEYLPDQAPPWHFVKDRFFMPAAAMLPRGGGESPEAKAWNEQLDKVDMGELTELDMALQIAVRQGYFDEEALAGFVDLIERRIKNADIEEKLRRAFHLYHSTLAPNEDDVVASFQEVVRSHPERVAAVTLNAVVMALRALGRDKEASELIAVVLKARAGDMEFFRKPLESVTDTELVAAMQVNTPVRRDDRPLEKIFIDGLWSYKGVSLLRLQEASVQDLKAALAKLDGAFDELIGALLQVTEVASNGRRVQENVLQALKELANETRINKTRLATYVDNPPPWEQPWQPKKPADNGEA